MSKFCTLFSVCVAVATQAYAQVLLADNFNDGSINGSLWTSTLPYFDSTVTQSGGALTSTNRGILISTGQFTGALEINTRVSLSGFGSALDLMWKSDGQGLTNMGTTAAGFFVSFLGGGGTGSLATGIKNVTANVNGQNWISMAVPLDTWVDVRVVDTGSSISVYLNGAVTPTASVGYTAADTTAIGSNGYLQFYSRENFGGPYSASMDYITVTAIPEPSTYAAIFGACALGLVAYRRHRLKKAA